MIAPSFPQTAGQEGEPILTGSSAALSPEQFAAACREIVTRHEGHEAHRMLDRLVTNLLSSLGYSEGMAIFLAAVSPYHEESRP